MTVSPQSKTKLNDLLGLVAKTLGGTLFTIGNNGFEIKIEDPIKAVVISIILMREVKDGKKVTHLSFKQHFFAKNNYGNSMIYRELDRIYLSVSPGSEVAFLFSDEKRFVVINVYKNCFLDIISGPEKRKEDSSLQEQTNNLYEAINKKKKEYLNKRRIFITI